VPWLHYIPLTLGGEEMVEAVRWATEEAEGREVVEQMAVESQRWAGKVLRNIDMEAYMFRLMLEYARVVDERREDIGFAL
jgi:predicted RNA-binding protein